MVNAYKPQSPVIKNQINFKVAEKEIKFYNLSPKDEGTYTQIVDTDFILTNISAFLASGTTSSKYHTLYLNNQILFYWVCNPLTTGAVSVEKEIPFPNILIRKGTIIKLIAAESGAQQLDCNYTFIGYYPKN